MFFESVIERFHTKENKLDAHQRAEVSLSQDRHAARRVPDPSRSNPYANKPAIAMTFLPVILAAR